MTSDGPTPVTVWVDPSCPWAWQTARWLCDLRDQGVVSLRWRLFSLELNATAQEDVPFDEATARYGGALLALALARREGGDDAFERVYVALGERLHDRKEPISPDLVGSAAAEAGMEGLVERTAASPGLVDEIEREFAEGRDRSVFGVPTLEIGGAAPIYGPILSLAPRGEDAAAWWTHVRWLADQGGFFEMKRWPRTRRPGEPA